MGKFIHIWMTCLVVLFFSSTCKKTSQAPIHVSQTNPTSDGPGATIEIDGSGFGNSAGSAAVYFNGAKQPLFR